MSLLCRGFCPSCHRVGLQILPVFLLRRHRGLLLLSFRCLFARLPPLSTLRADIHVLLFADRPFPSTPPRKQKTRELTPSLVISCEICDTITTDRTQKKKKTKEKKKKVHESGFYVFVLSPVHTVHTFCPTFYIYIYIFVVYCCPRLEKIEKENDRKVAGVHRA